MWLFVSGLFHAELSRFLRVVAHQRLFLLWPNVSTYGQTIHLLTGAWVFPPFSYCERCCCCGHGWPVQVPLSVLLDPYLEAELLGPTMVLCLTLETPPNCPQQQHHFTLPPALCEGSSFSTSLLTLAIPRFLILAILPGVKWCLASFESWVSLWQGVGAREGSTNQQILGLAVSQKRLAGAGLPLHVGEMQDAGWPKAGVREPCDSSSFL